MFLHEYTILLPISSLGERASQGERVLASHQCGPGSIPIVKHDVIWYIPSSTLQSGHDKRFSKKEKVN